MGLLFYVAGFASGWVVRGTVDSSRGLVVGGLSAVIGLADRAKRFSAIEREYIEDLVAEAKARFEERRGRQDEAAARVAADGKSEKEYVQ
jgi:hypothetical protein